ncbi:cytochrome c [Arcicella aquatica]|uniref:Cytochrome c n=1 Tax=Arcicella aquatica TaxID=217141 RepID=A0ABU5QPB5_9BACT|nr:cytochrome c [Arcicella aquatica]MEA5258942.1 cytochrome c [Arcicella aquatica]
MKTFILHTLQTSLLILLVLTLTFGFVIYFYFEIKAQPEIQPIFYCGVVDNVEVNNGYNDNGESIFKNNCAACHSISDEILVGPGLRDVSERRPLKWIVKWVHNPQKVIKSGDKYANKLYYKFNQAQMTPYPNLTEKDIIDILKYIN